MANLPGSGTEADPYQISGYSDLSEINVSPGANYILTQDIDGTGNTLSPIEFNGVLDGDGYTVANIDLSVPTNYRTSIFNTPSGGTAELNNLNFDNITSSSADINSIHSLLFAQEGSSDFDNNTYILNNVTIQNSVIDYQGSTDSGLVANRGNVQLQDVEILNCSITTTDSGAQIGIICSRAYSNSSASNVTVQDSSVDGGLATGAFFRDIYGGTYNNLYSINNELTSGFPTGFAWDVANATISNLVVEGVTTKNNDNRGSRGVFGILGSNSTVNSLKVKDFTAGRASGNDGSSSFIGDGQGELNDVYVKGGTLDALNGDSAVISTGGSLTINNFYVASTSSLDLVGSDDFFANGSSNYTFSGLYYDSDTTSISNTVATGLTTSEMQGQEAEINLTEFDFTNTWAVITQEKDGQDDYPRLNAFYDAPFAANITLNSPEDGANFVSGETFAFDFSVTNNEGSIDAAVDLNITSPDSGTNNPISQTLTAGSSDTYNYSGYSSTTLGSGSWEVVVDGADRSPATASRTFEIFDESELSFDVDATDLSRVFFDAEISGGSQVSYTVFVNGSERFSSDLSPSEHGVKTRFVDVSGQSGATTVAVRVETGQNSTGSGLEVFNIRTDQVI